MFVKGSKGQPNYCQGRALNEAMIFCINGKRSFPVHRLSKLLALQLKELARGLVWVFSTVGIPLTWTPKVSTIIAQRLSFHVLLGFRYKPPNYVQPRCGDLVVMEAPQVGGSFEVLGLIHMSSADKKMV